VAGDGRAVRIWQVPRNRGLELLGAPPRQARIRRVQGDATRQPVRVPPIPEPRRFEKVLQRKGDSLSGAFF
jgi:hypothetical protein